MAERCATLDVMDDAGMNDAVVVRQRADGSRELRVNGVFVMDDLQTTSERLLARGLSGDVLVGGLGLGFTVRELLTGDVTRVLVAELHPEVVEAVELPADPRLEVVIGDVRDVVTTQPRGSLDAIVLDVDNGPDFLVHDHNAALYEDDFIGVCAARLRAAGRLTIWSMADSRAVRDSLARRFGDVEVTEVPVVLQGRQESYWLLTGIAPSLQSGT